MLTILDRHMLRVFAKVLLISFLALTGLFIVIDLFGNLEEFITYADRQGSLLQVLTSYYGARVLSFFDMTSSLLALMACMFTLTWLQRTNEMTALMAGGIPKTRIARPLIGAAIAVALLAAANREWGLPAVRDKLSRNAQDWLGDSAQTLNPRYDYKTGILLGGKSTIAAEQKIENPSFRLTRAIGKFGRQLVAGAAYYRPVDGDRPSGYLLVGVSQPTEVAGTPSAFEDGNPVILTGRDTPWLDRDECFVVSDVTFEHLAANRAWRQYSSTPTLISALRNPSLDFGQETRVAVHARFVQPILDVTLLFLGLPLALRRGDQNLFVTAARGLLVVSIYFVVVLACHAMGGTGFLITPAFAAWLPLLLFLPLAYVVAARRWE